MFRRSTTRLEKKTKGADASGICLYARFWLALNHGGGIKNQNSEAVAASPASVRPASLPAYRRLPSAASLAHMPPPSPVASVWSAANTRQTDADKI